MEGILKFSKNKDIFSKLCLSLSLFTLYSATNNEKFNIFDYFTLPKLKISLSSDLPSNQELDCRGAILLWLQYIAEEVQTLNLAPNLMY